VITITPRSLTEGARVLGRHGGVVEVRILKTVKGTVSGYFDDLDALVKAMRPWDGRANIYVTANPVLSDLLARAKNRLREFVRATTEDKQITRRTWFLVDLDPERPADISATDVEVAAALVRRNELVAFLIELGFRAPVAAMSGNGAHALWLVDLPNDETTTSLIERALKALKAKFSDNMVRVDEAVFNAARIWKLYGTTAVKGDATPERPHRCAQLEHVLDDLVPVERGLLERLAAMAPAERTYTSPSNVTGRRHRVEFDLVGIFQARGWYLKPLHGGKHAVTCPWASEHSADSGITETCIFEPATLGARPSSRRIAYAMHCIRGLMQSALLCGASSSEAPLAGHREGFSLRITDGDVSEAMSASGALNRPDRSVGGITDSRASNFTEGSARVYISVVCRCACPSQSATFRRSLVACRTVRAQVCRNTCGDTRFVDRVGQRRRAVWTCLRRMYSNPTGSRGHRAH
jgi:hypothetical protein